MNASWKLIIIARSDRARIPRSMRITRYGTCPLQTCRSNTRPVPVPTRTRARGFSIAPPDDELLIAAHSFATGLLSSKPRIQTQIRIIAIIAPSILHLVASSILTDLLAEMEHRIRMHRIILRFVSFFDAQNNVKRDACLLEILSYRSSINISIPNAKVSQEIVTERYVVFLDSLPRGKKN